MGSWRGATGAGNELSADAERLLALRHPFLLSPLEVEFSLLRCLCPSACCSTSPSRQRAASLRFLSRFLCLFDRLDSPAAWAGWGAHRVSILSRSALLKLSKQGCLKEQPSPSLQFLYFNKNLHAVHYSSVCLNWQRRPFQQPCLEDWCRRTWAHQSPSPICLLPSAVP